MTINKRTTEQKNTRTTKQNNWIRKYLCLILSLLLLMGMTGCGSKEKNTSSKESSKTSEQSTKKNTEADTEKKESGGEKKESSGEKKESSGEKKEVIVLAAASLTDVCGELEKTYETEHPEIDLVFSYAGSGALQTQIEEGAPADIFISASGKQMKALKEKSLMMEDTITDLLENKVVLVTPKEGAVSLTSFNDVTRDDVKMIGLGEIESVPAGQYAKTIFTNLGIWEEVEKKANFGTDVRTVLTWVESGNVSCGVVYATDAHSSDKVTIVAEAPEGSCDKVIYPAGVVGTSKNPEEAKAFLDFLKSDSSMKTFESYGFTAVR